MPSVTERLQCQLQTQGNKTGNAQTRAQRQAHGAGNGNAAQLRDQRQAKSDDRRREQHRRQRLPAEPGADARKQQRIAAAHTLTLAQPAIAVADKGEAGPTRARAQQRFGGHEATRQQRRSKTGQDKQTSQRQRQPEMLGIQPGQQQQLPGQQDRDEFKWMLHQQGNSATQPGSSQFDLPVPWVDWRATGPATAARPNEACQRNKVAPAQRHTAGIASRTPVHNGPALWPAHEDGRKKAADDGTSQQPQDDNERLWCDGCFPERTRQQRHVARVQPFKAFYLMPF